MNKQTQKVDPGIFGTSLIGTDIFMLLLAESKTAILYLSLNYSIALSIVETSVTTCNNMTVTIRVWIQTRSRLDLG